MAIMKIISGGQTGSDQAGLDVAIKHGIPHGGAIPKGRMTEDGVLDSKYNLTEMSTKSYPKRTEKNVLDSDGTVILTHGKLTGGSLLTRKKALEHYKPVLHLNMSKVDIGKAVGLLTAFVDEDNIKVLNVAGSRASKDSLIYEKTFAVVDKIV
jgi:putative molybdenum carrier protein